MIDKHYTKPESKNTPMMTVPAIMTWIDLEIEHLKSEHRFLTNQYIKDIKKGTWLHLELMKAQLTDYTLAQLDGVPTNDRNAG